MISVINTSSNKNTISKPLKSTHGKLLLHELALPLDSHESISSRNEQINLKLQKCLEYVRLDPNACLLRVPSSGNTAYHLLVGSDYTEDFILPLLHAFLTINPSGVSMKNKAGNLPLHCSLYQPVIIESVAMKLLQIYPDGASVMNNSELIPLFFAVMRDHSSFELCKALCKAYPDSVKTTNKTKSIPLHFACKRKYPNLQVLQMLARRYSAGAGLKNDYGMLPLHILSSYCYDIECIRVVTEAYPEAISILDRQGRTCLHLAVLAVGKDHEAVIAKEQEEEERLFRENQQSTLMEDETSHTTGEDDETEDPQQQTILTHSITVLPEKDIFERKEGKSREILRYFISLHPKALITLNNFQALPVDTVLEKAKRAFAINQKVSKYKSIRVYGLYDDPPTARLLLCSHNYFASKNILPKVPGYYREVLHDLNWFARRLAIQVSYTAANGNSLFQFKNNSTIPINQTNVSKSSSKSTKLKGNSNNSNNSGTKNKNGIISIGSDTSNQTTTEHSLSLDSLHLRDPGLNGRKSNDDYQVFMIDRKNLLSRLRHEGYMDLVIHCISWI